MSDVEPRPSHWERTQRLYFYALISDIVVGRYGEGGSGPPLFAAPGPAMRRLACCGAHPVAIAGEQDGHRFDYTLFLEFRRQLHAGLAFPRAVFRSDDYDRYLHLQRVLELNSVGTPEPAAARQLHNSRHGPGDRRRCDHRRWHNSLYIRRDGWFFEREVR